MAGAKYRATIFGSGNPFTIGGKWPGPSTVLPFLDLATHSRSGANGRGQVPCYHFWIWQPIHDRGQMAGAKYRATIFGSGNPFTIGGKGLGPSTVLPFLDLATHSRSGAKGWGQVP